MTTIGSDRHLWRGRGWKPSTNVCFTCGFTRAEVDRRRRDGAETRCRLLRTEPLVRGTGRVVAHRTPEPIVIDSGFTDEVERWMDRMDRRG